MCTCTSVLSELAKEMTTRPCSLCDTLSRKGPPPPIVTWCWLDDGEDEDFFLGGGSIRGGGGGGGRGGRLEAVAVAVAVVGVVSTIRNPDVGIRLVEGDFECCRSSGLSVMGMAEKNDKRFDTAKMFCMC